MIDRDAEAVTDRDAGSVTDRGSDRQTRRDPPVVPPVVVLEKLMLEAKMIFSSFVPTVVASRFVTQYLAVHHNS